MDSVFAQLAQAGLEIEGPLRFGVLVRCRADGDKGRKQSGWYVAHEFRLDSGETVVVGRYGNWKRYGAEALKIEIDRRVLSAGERQRIEQQQQQLRAQAEQEKRERAAEAASRAHRIWAKLPDTGRSAYLDRKKVGAYGIRFSRGSIVVPVTLGTELVGLQFIAGDGEKKFLTGTPKHGASHLLGRVANDYAGLLWIAEGYATAATVHEATRQPVVMAFDAGNLLPVAQHWKRWVPAAQLVFAADNDSSTKGNPGVTKAREAASQVRGLVVVPSFEGIAA